MPPRVEYKLTDFANTLVPIWELMKEWGTEHKKTNQIVLNSVSTEPPLFAEMVIKTIQKAWNLEISGFLYFIGIQNMFRFLSCKEAIRWVPLEIDTTHRIVYE